MLRMVPEARLIVGNLPSFACLRGTSSRASQTPVGLAAVVVLNRTPYFLDMSPVEGEVWSSFLRPSHKTSGSYHCIGWNTSPWEPEPPWTDALHAVRTPAQGYPQPWDLPAEALVYVEQRQASPLCLLEFLQNL